jgi:hypothetical protein
MCLIIHAEPRFDISQDLMDDFSAKNDDGFGVMWIENNRINAEKFGPTEMDKLWPTYQRLKNTDHFIHLRMRTHGDTNAAMAHPYYCGYGIWLMHNGILNDVQGADKSKSDTWYFIQDILNPLFKSAANPHEFMRSKAFATLLQKFLGHGNRVVMGDRGGWVLFNTPSWHPIDNDLTGVKGMLVSNQYAWSADRYGKPSRTTWYQGGTQSPLPLARTTTGQEKKPTGTSGMNKESQSLFDKAIKDTFYPLGRDWFINKFGKVFRIKDYRITPRPDLDDREQFWNTFENETLIEAGVWIAEQNNVEEPESSSVITIPETTLSGDSLVLPPTEKGKGKPRMTWAELYAVSAQKALPSTTQ